MGRESGAGDTQTKKHLEAQTTRHEAKTPRVEEGEEEEEEDDDNDEDNGDEEDEKEEEMRQRKTKWLVCDSHGICGGPVTYFIRNVKLKYSLTLASL